jgi:hypothetical protein
MESVIKDIETIRSVFEQYKVSFYVVYGVALGFHRDKKFLPGDEDVDFAVVDNIDLQTRKAIGWTLFDLGFNPQNIAFNVFGRMEPSEIGYNGDAETGIIVCERNFKFTIFFFKEEDCEQHGREKVCIPKLGAVKLISSPAKFYEKHDTITINKKKYKVPHPIKDYLAFTYGDWKDPLNRKHGDTYFEMHSKHDPLLDITNKNQVNIYENS